MPIFIMLGLYFGLFYCTLLYLRKTNNIKRKTKGRIQSKKLSTNHGNSNVKHRLKRK